jgi:hypothetical protein
MPECFCRAFSLTINEIALPRYWIPTTPCPQGGGALGESTRE